MKNIIINTQNTFLFLFTLLNCSGPSNERLVDNLVNLAKFSSGDSTILEIDIYTKDGKPSLLIDNYDRATILSATPSINSFHSINASLYTDEWHITKIEKIQSPYGVQFTGVGTPKLDFADFLKIILESKDLISSPFVTLFTPLVFPILDTALYQTTIFNGTDSVFAINSINGKRL